ncbi:hypothetical protein Cs7R123_09280 [Catellatospora sp. TT07R-123]|uniref:hypothetical protein n=1 Tax=Catellatospora sp. TT07R-123 TaxID=2733863 RepID=UPI001B07CBF6|nr:hypothetical protein [Catellatospora sp. TT07R-123]GHJ43586.1 hypothetical protein Cs7R123_09280 [Catellatospora sp. TT07R-123]
MSGNGTQGNGMSVGARVAILTVLAGVAAAGVAAALRRRNRRDAVIAEKDLGPKSVDAAPADLHAARR